MSFLNWLIPGNDTQLAEDYATKRRAGHRRNTTKTARAGQAWEDRDRQQDRKGRWYRAAR